MGVEGRVVLVLLVEDEEVGVLGRAMRPVGEAAGLGLANGGHLLLEERGQRIALALRRPHLRDHREHVSHGSLSSVTGSCRWPPSARCRTPATPACPP